MIISAMLSECNGGDNSSYCHTMPARDCYVLASICCDTCSGYFQPNAVGMKSLCVNFFYSALSAAVVSPV